MYMYVYMYMKLNTGEILLIQKSDGGKQLRERAGILKWSFKMFMYILLHLEMSVCTSGGVLSGKQLP